MLLVLAGLAYIAVNRERECYWGRSVSWKESPRHKQNHGLGMMSTRRIVESYGGYMQIEAMEGVFQLVIFREGFHEDAE